MARATLAATTLLTTTMAAALLMTGLAACERTQDTNALLADARQYRQKGQTRAAIIQLKNVVQKEPENAPARILLAELYVDIGDAISAEKELRRAQALGMKPAELLPRLGKVMLMQGQFQKILDDFKAAPATQDQTELTLLRASAFLGLGEIEQARGLFEFVLKKTPDQGGALLGLAKIAAASQDMAAATSLIKQVLARHPADVDALRLQGDVLRLQGKNDAAMLVYAQILALRPENSQTLIDMASLHIQAGKFTEARAAIAAARKTTPNSLLVLYTQALLDFREKKFKPALDALQQVLRVAPDHMPSILLMGSVQVALGSDQQAEQYLQKFLDANPRNAYASKQLAAVELKSGKPDAALDLLGPLLPTGQNDVELLALTGQAQMGAKHFSQAAALFQKASDLAPHAAGLHTGLGMSLLGMGENARATAELESAATMDGGNVQAGILLVMTYLNTKQFDKALTAVSALERRQEKNPMVHNLKGGVLIAKRDIAAARASFQQALVLNPVYLPALENLVQLDLLEKKPEQAKQRFEAALDKDKKNVSLMAALAKLAATQGDKAETARWLERASAENPDALAPAMSLASFYLRTGKNEKSLVLAQKIQASNPASPEALTLLAQIQFGNGNYDAALESFAKLAALQPASAAVQLGMAQVQMKLKDQAGALESARKALQLQADSMEAQVVAVTLLAEQKKYPEALAIAQTAQRQRPQAPAGLTLEGNVWMAQNKPLEALKAYERAFSLKKDGLLLIKIHDSLMLAGKTQDARLRLTQWLLAHPTDIPIRLFAASEKLASKEYLPAIDDLEKIVGQAPNHVIALNDLAWACQQQGDKRALGFAERAFKLAPGNPEIIDTLAWILVEQGDVTRAVPLLEKARALAPNATEIRYHLGMGLVKAGDKRAARTLFEQMLASKSDFPKRDEVKALLARL